MSEYNGTTLRSKKARVLSSLYDYTSNIAGEKGLSSTRGVAASTAATLLSMGITRLEAQELARNENLQLSIEDAELIEGMALSAEDYQQQKGKEQAHFMDRFMERLIDNTIPKDSPDAQLLQERIKDPSRSEKKPLSLVLLVSNLKRTSLKMGGFFRLQYGLIHILTWRNQAKTLFMLVVYTSVCLWPHLVVCFPLLILLFGVILPHYLLRHPMDLPEILPVKKRGQSFFQFFTESQNSSLLSDYLNVGTSTIDEAQLCDSSIISGTGTMKSSDETSTRPSSVAESAAPEESNKRDKTKIIKSQVSLLMNMRDLQNLTTDLLDSLEKGETLATDILSFKNERLSTVVFFIVILLTLVVFFLGQFIPWKLIFISMGYIVLSVLHPGAKDVIAALSKGQNNSKSQAAPRIIVPKAKPGQFLEAMEFENIIVDNEPDTRVVEIFELQAKDIFKHEWSLFAYSKRIYDWKDPVRISGRYPHGVNHLRKVLPPKEWKYDFGYASNWFIDTDPITFITDRRLDQTHLSVREEDMDTEGWIYDNIPLDQENVKEFRRRRLYRTCYRYARPVDKIKFA